MRHLSGYPAALLLTLLFYALGLSASTRWSATFDEPIHLAGGYLHWTQGQNRIHTENGFLPQAIAAFPLLFTTVHPPDPTSPEFLDAEPFALGKRFVYHSGNNAAQLLLLGRAAIGLLAAATALVVYTWTRRLFNPAGAMLALLVFTLAPAVLANGFLITSDIAVALFFLVTLAATWHSFQTLTPTRTLLAGLGTGALFLSKMSAPVILPALLLCLLARANHPSPLFLRNRPLLTHTTRLRALALSFCSQMLIAWITIWAAYGFHYSAFAALPIPGQTFYPAAGWDWALQNPSLTTRAIASARQIHLLPEAYLYGYAYVAQKHHWNPAYVNGLITSSGVWWYFPWLALITTPIPLLLLFTAASALALRRLAAAGGKRFLRLYPFLPLLFFFFTYAIAAIASFQMSGQRHLLPLFAIACIALGILPRYAKKPSARLALLAGVAWLAIESFCIRPFYLSSFNEFIGGPHNGYKYLANSALDWGQDLPALADYLRRQPPDQPVYLSYFGTADPACYGLHPHILPSSLPLPYEPADEIAPLRPGIYCISATTLQTLFLNFEGPYNPQAETAYKMAKRDLPAVLPGSSTRPAAGPLDHYHEARFARLCAFLRRRTPDAQAGYSINIYHLTAADLDAALNRPLPPDTLQPGP
jgi:hypothetical protein